MLALFATNSVIPLTVLESIPIRPAVHTLQVQMDFQPLLVQAHHQVPARKSSNKSSIQVSGLIPSPNQLLRGAARRSPRPSASATATPYALPSTTRPSLPEDLIQARDRTNFRPSVVKSPIQHHSQIPPLERDPPVNQAACLSAPKRRHTTKEPSLKKSSKFMRVST